MRSGRFSSPPGRSTAARVAATYALLGALWILLSDRALQAVVADPGTMTLLQIVKGCLYVIVTALVIYVALRRAHGLLWDSESRYRRIVQTAAEGIATTDAESRLVFVNPRFAAMLGYTPDELAGQPLLNYVDPASRPVVLASLARRATGHDDQYECEFRRRDGQRIWVRVSATPQLDEAGRYIGSLGMLTDVTDAHRARQELERFFTVALEILAIADLDTRLRRANPALARALGYALDELRGRALVDDIHPGDRAAAEAALRGLRAGGSVSQFEARFRHRDGGYRWLSWTCIAIPDEGLMYGAGRDVTEQKRAEQALRESESRLRTMIEASPIGILLYDVEGRLLNANPAALHLFGLQLEQIRGFQLFDDPHLPPTGAARLRAGHEARFEVRYDFDEIRRRGVYESARAGARDFEVIITPIPHFEGVPSGYLTQVQDITERRRLEAQLQQAQKLEAIGQLAGGVAHDFNNILTAIFGSLELLREALARTSSSRETLENLDQVERASQRAALLTRQLLTFSRHQVVQPQLLDLSRVVSEMRPMLERLIREDITLEFRLAPTLAGIHGDPGQIEQVVLNLVVNARDALESGRITLETADADVTPADVATHPDAIPGPHVRLTVRDTGAGMAPAVLARIFEPFFTTKPAGSGTGLGLATVQGIVRHAGGHIRVQSTPGQGSTFEVYFPAAAQPAAVHAPVPALPEAPGGSETLLICEDDPAVRQLMLQTLTGRGYHVLAAGHPAEAQRLAAQAGHIDLLVTDVVLPVMDGRQLAHAVSRARPGLRVLYVSGYSSEVIAHHGLLDPGIELLQKPFRAATLLQRVRALLDQVATGTHA